MTTEKDLVEKGFEEVINNEGAFVLELTITENIKVRTWGRSENENVMGVYLYDKRSDTYTQALPLD